MKGLLALRIDPDALTIVKVTDHDQADVLLELQQRAMMLYAQETRIPLYRRDGSYSLPSLNETRGDIIEAMDREDLLAARYQERWVGSVRLVSDQALGKTLLTRFSIDPRYHSLGIGSELMETACTFLKGQGIREVYLYTAQHNERLMAFYRRHQFFLYSVNSGRPYPKVCLLRYL